MYKFYVAPTPYFLQAFYDLPARSAAQFRVELQTKVKPVLQKQVDATFGSDPGPVKRPIDWTSVKQRAAFFATNGFGGGIPTKRTDKLRTSWVVIVGTQLRTNLITLYNNRPEAKFVYPGADQQRFHRNTGWGRDFDKYTQDLERTEDVEIANAWGRAVAFALRTQR